jgi:uncharacterized membrane protein
MKIFGIFPENQFPGRPTMSTEFMPSIPKELFSMKRGLTAVLVFAALDSIAMTALDILIDPLWVSRGTWVWTGLDKLQPESIFYNIPVQNYFGWLLTTAVIFTVFRFEFLFFELRGALRSNATKFIL